MSSASDINSARTWPVKLSQMTEAPRLALCLASWIMSSIFQLSTGIFWTAAYVLLIRVGLRDKTFGMPIVAFATNISWEFCFAIVRPSNGISHWIDATWLLFDCAIGYTVLRYGPREFPHLDRRLFYAAFAGLLALAYVGMNEASLQFDDGRSTVTAFASNIAMSGLFLAMLTTRGGSRGQSIGIAATKLLGTACASLSELTAGRLKADYHTPLMHYMYITCLILDLAYLTALILVRRHEKTESRRS
jgi:hypothetical protein